MNNGLIAARYATALLEYASKNSSIDRVYTEAKAVTKSYFQFNELRTVLNNPVLARAEKRKIILMAAGGQTGPQFERFIDMLLENNREEHLPDIMLKYVDLYRKQMNIHSGKLTTATSIETTVEKRLMALMEQKTGGTVELEKIVDPIILGGFMFEVDFERWDASLSGQLRRIKSEYIEQNKRSM